MLGAFFSDWTASVPGFGYRDPLMLDGTKFDQLIVCERLRANRRGIPFCVITLTITGSAQRRRRAILLARLLHRHLRMTDQKGVLGPGKFGVLLVDTPEMGGRCAMDRLIGLISNQKLGVDVTLSVHDQHGFGSDGPPPAIDGRRRGDVTGDSTDAGNVEKPTEPLKAGRSDGDDASLPDGESPSLSDSPRDRLQNTQEESSATAVLIRSVTQTASEPFEPHVSYAVYDMPPPPRPRIRMGIKRAVDLVGATTGMVLLGPVLAVAMVLIRREDGGPALFKQTREGMDGKPFTIYKLRSMVVDAERRQDELRSQSHRDGPAFKINRDPRITAVGHILRRTCIDELPQLWNVIKGDMSLVGPRPLPWHESRQCKHWHRRRLELRPGLTCYWQINKGAIESFDDWMRLDLRYVDRFNLWEDVRLIFQTIKVPVLGRGSE